VTVLIRPEQFALLPLTYSSAAAAGKVTDPPPRPADTEGVQGSV